VFRNSSHDHFCTGGRCLAHRLLATFETVVRLLRAAKCNRLCASLSTRICLVILFFRFVDIFCLRFCFLHSSTLFIAADYGPSNQSSFSVLESLSDEDCRPGSTAVQMESLVGKR
jgi:hypothetical protein